jgi:hypothetical protein
MKNNKFSMNENQMGLLDLLIPKIVSYAAVNYQKYCDSEMLCVLSVSLP